MKTAECEGIEAVGELLADACVARVLSVDPIPGSHNVKAVVDAGGSAAKTVVCGAPNCRPGVVTAYVPIGKKGHPRRGERRHAGQRCRTGHQPRPRRHPGTRRGAWQACCAGHADSGLPPDSIIEIDNKSITHRPDLWGHHGMAREVAAILGKKLIDPVRLDLLPAGPPAHPGGDRRPGPVPAVLRAGVRKRHRPPVALVAAIPAHVDRPEPHQQHRRPDQLRDGRAGAAHARLRRRQAARRHHLRPPGPRRRALPRAERRRVHAGAVQPGDCRRRRAPSRWPA